MFAMIIFDDSVCVSFNTEGNRDALYNQVDGVSARSFFKLTCLLRIRKNVTLLLEK